MASRSQAVMAPATSRSAQVTGYPSCRRPPRCRSSAGASPSGRLKMASMAITSEETAMANLLCIM